MSGALAELASVVADMLVSCGDAILPRRVTSRKDARFYVGSAIERHALPFTLDDLAADCPTVARRRAARLLDEWTRAGLLRIEQTSYGPSWRRTAMWPPSS